MASYSFERLSAQDNTFLLGETPNTPMHVAGIEIFEAGNLRTADGGIDFTSILKSTEAVLHKIPRYRQKLQWTPVIEQPVWVDDPDFNLDYHVRHTSLPQPGDRDQLKRMAARIMEQQLDRERPLWELWVVEGLEDNLFALISKIHHCMIDGSSGVDLAQILMSDKPEYTIPEAPRYLPKPAPSDAELLASEAWHRASQPWRAIQGFREFRREADDLQAEIGLRARALRDMAGWAVRSSSDTPINGPLGPHRRFDWLVMPLDEVKAVRRAAKCSVNDVVLTLVTGAVRAYMQKRQVDPAELDFRVSAPVSVRRDDEKGQLGNRVSSWIIQLPLGEPDASSQLAAIHAATQELKESKQALGVEMMMQVAEWTPPVLLSLGAQSASGPINTIVTNVPGPQFPLYMLGARLLEMYPVVPLLEGLGLGIAIFSYDGQLCWGFNADYAQMPDLPVFPKLIDEAFRAFAAEVGVEIDRAPHEVGAA
jgi:WS/DGAT/MGAT family acyltransferase